MDETVREADRKQLESLLIDLAEKNSGWEREIRERLGPSTDKPDDNLRPDDLRKRVYNLIHSLDRMKASQAYWQVSEVVNDIQEITENLRSRLGEGNDRRITDVLEAVVDEYVSEWLVLDGSDGSTAMLYRDFAEVLTEAYLSLDLPESQRAERAERVETWQQELEGYSVDRQLEPARIAALSGEEYEPLQRAVSDEEPNPDFNMESPFDRVLVESYLRVLNRRGETEKYRKLAMACGDAEAVVEGLVKDGRAGEALEWVRSRLDDPRQAKPAFEILWSEAPDDEVLEVGREFVLNSGETTWTGSLAEWLRDRAIERDRTDVAREMAREACMKKPSLSNYEMTRQLWEDEWSIVREEILDVLRADPHSRTQGTIDVFLEADEYGQALDRLESVRDFDLIRRVCRQSIEACPGRVRGIAREQAEDIMDNGRSKAYEAAKDWLQLVRRSYELQNEPAGWNAYREDLLNKHSRKYKLVPKLEELGRIKP